MSGSGTTADPYICLINEEFDPEGRIVRHYNIIGAASVITALTALVASADCPAVHPEVASLNRQGPRIVEDEEDYRHYTATVEYTTTDLDPAIGGIKLIPGAAQTNTVRQKQAFSTTGQYAASGQTAQNTYGMIGATKEGVEGIDEEDPGFSFGLEVRLTKGTLTLAEMASVGAMHKSVNNATWKGFAAGEILFDHYEFDIENEDYDIARMYFRYSPNETNITIASPWGNIVVANKRGWDYLDFNQAEITLADGRVYKATHTVTVCVTKRYKDLNSLV